MKKNGAILGGTFGTSPISIKKIFKDKKFKTEKTSRISDMASQSNNNITNILIYRGLNSNNNWFSHYTSFVKTDDKNKFKFYNRKYGLKNDVQDLKDIFKGTFLLIKICISISNFICN